MGGNGIRFIQAHRGALEKNYDLIQRLTSQEAE